MPPDVGYLQATMPAIRDQFNEMSNKIPVDIHYRVQCQWTFRIQSNFPLYVQISPPREEIQPTASNEIKLLDVTPQNLSFQVTDKKEQNLIPFKNRDETNEMHTSMSENANAQIAVKSPALIPAVPRSGWNPNFAVAVLRDAGLLNNLWLVNLEKITRHCELSEVLPGLLELKTALYEYTVVIDKMLMHYTRRDLSCGKKDVTFPSVSAVLESNDKLKMIISKLNPKDLKNIFSNDIVLTEEDILCAFLGLNEGVVNYLKNISQEYRDHEPDEYYIKSYLQEKAEYLENSMKGNINICAKECGFTEVRAQTFAYWLNNCVLRNHQPLSLWLDRYVENMFKYALHLSGNMPRFPFEVKPDRLVKVETERYEEDEEGNPTPVKFNVSVRNCSMTYHNFSYPKIQKNQIFWFHGTDHLSAISILEEGIQPRRGRAMQDFSDDDGFCVSSDFVEAKKWAFVWSRPAVLVFEVDINKENFQVLDLRHQRETQWKQIVKYNRSGRSRKFTPTKDLRQRFDDCDCVLGPCTTDGSKGTREMPGYESWHPAGYNNTNLQLCIRSEDMAKEFGKPSKIKAVIFY